ncbi:NAD(P)/FAD-dependent oxidoreductase [Halogranum rubrum]|uniref:NADH dehydrogenase, fad-containing subunit n=1 Tax=Halogranum salarium B-1 TaxID=1210908 RepID=J3JFQ5_9EURY|nr:FAD-dependent oxidoreductase [Halogranum salarium]EJN59459.1 NADH dehydrogenase, fad-containing subunit [Halogranum salarium B-1]
MTRVVVLGSGYAGCAAVQSLEAELDESDTEVVWVSKEPYHLVLHEVHRYIRNPGVRDHITVPVEEVKSDETTFVHAAVTGLDVEDRTVELDGAENLDYDYAVVCLGSQTAFFDVDGLREYGHTVKSLDDARRIREELRVAAREGTSDDPAQVVVGGAGLTGIQVAGEIAAWRDERDAPVDVHLLDEEDEIFAGHDHEFQGAIRNQLEAHDVDIETETAISSVDEETVHLDGADDRSYDVLVWAGGVTGQDALSDADVEKDHNRAYADATLKTSDERVFAIGDAALMHQDDENGPLTEGALWETVVNPDTDDVPPPTAEAAWEAGKHLGENVARDAEGRELAHWVYTNKGTLVSIGDAAVAHEVLGIPINTFGGPAARNIKRAISARWLGTVSSWRRAARAWPEM